MATRTHIWPIFMPPQVGLSSVTQYYTYTWALVPEAYTHNTSTDCFVVFQGKTVFFLSFTIPETDKTPKSLFLNLQNDSCTSPALSASFQAGLERHQDATRGVASWTVTALHNLSRCLPVSAYMLRGSQTPSSSLRGNDTWLHHSQWCSQFFTVMGEKKKELINWKYSNIAT